MMDVALVVVSILLAALITFSAALKLTHRPKVVESYRTAGVPETWLNVLAALLLLAAAGLLVGIWWPAAGFAAAVGLVAYFLLAVGFHIRANDTAHVATPAVLTGVAAAVVALHVLSF
jgi:DoxX-like family